MASASPQIKNLADLQARLGNVPLDRIRFRPWPGSATVQDIIEIQAHEGVLCELIEGVLLEKAVGYLEAGLTIYLVGIIDAFVRQHNLGIVTGPDGTLELHAGLVRIPDIAFTHWDRLPGRRYPLHPVPRLAPNLAIEVLSRSNTANEMAAKLQDYFAAGVELVWEIDPAIRMVTVYTNISQSKQFALGDTLDGDTVLPNFSLSVQDLFAELDRHD